MPLPSICSDILLFFDEEYVCMYVCCYEVYLIVLCCGIAVEAPARMGGEACNYNVNLDICTYNQSFTDNHTVAR